MDCTNSSSSHPKQYPREIHGDNEGKSPKLSKKGNPNPKFLGVRQRPSGRWVAEIKNSSQKVRLWLGTFDRAEEAAMAYDAAARLLRGTNAKTNFPFEEMTKTHDGFCSLHAKNPRFYQLLNHAIMKNKAKCANNGSSGNRGTQVGLVGFSSAVQETVVCSPQNNTVVNGGLGSSGFDQEINEFCGFSFCGCKVYSTVHVAPSFNASMHSSGEGKKWCEQVGSDESMFVFANELMGTSFM